MWVKWAIAVFFVLWALAMWAGLVYVVWRGWGPFIRSKRQRKTSVDAIVCSKQGREDYDPINWQVELVQKVLVFECDDGVKRDYEVHDDIWDWVEVGDDGILTYQGDLFVEFDSRRPRHDLDKLYKNLTRG